MITPILISHPARSGTTILMRTLSGSSEIAVAKTPPYEVKLLAYYAHVFRVLTSTTGETTHPDVLAGRDNRFGANPYFRGQFAALFKDRPSQFADLVEHRVPDIFAGAMRQCIEAYYGAYHGVAMQNWRYFAEKNDSASPMVVAFAKQLFGSVREITTIRDPRDMFCSHLSYFKNDPAVAARDAVFACRNALKILANPTPDTLVVRYEDMIRTPETVRKTLISFLGVEIPPADPTEGFSRHATSASRDASIGRWKTDMTEEHRALYLPKMAETIKQLGYEE